MRGTPAFVARAVTWSRVETLRSLAVAGAGVVLALVTASVMFDGRGGRDAPPSTSGAGPTTTVQLDGPPPADGLRFGMVGLEHLDPAFVLPSDQSGMIAVDLLFDPLTNWDPATASVQPALAESWTPADAATLWTFHLRGDAQFHDGAPIRAIDVKRSLERVARLGNISLAGVRLDVIAGYSDLAAGFTDELVGVQAIDERTLEVRTLEPYASLPELLSSPLYGIVPSSAAGGVDLPADSGAASPQSPPVPALQTAPVGSGPYRFVGRDGPIVTLEPASAGAALASIELVAFGDPADAYAAFEAGDVDWSVAPAGQLDEARAAYGERAVIPFEVTLVIGFNLAHPSYEDVRFRSGIAKAIDRQALLESPLEAAVGLDGVIPDGVPGSVADACGALCSYDPNTARALVAQAFPDGKTPTVQLDVYDDPVERAVADAVAEDLRAVGVPVEVVARPFEEYQQFVVSGGQQFFVFGWAGVAVDADVFVGPQFLSASQDNATGFADPVADLAMKAARAETDPAARAELWRDVNRQVMRGVPIVPVAQHVTAAVVGERVEGYVARPDGTFDTRRLTLAP